MKYRNGLLMTGVAAIVLLAVGCLVSGTFVVTEPFSFTAETGFYAYQVDVTDEKDWEDHKDDIDNIDMVGFELWITNNEAFPVTFNAWVDDADNPFCTGATCFDALTTKTIIIDNLTIPAGPTMRRHVTYGESFTYLENVKVLKKLVKEGRLNFYGTGSDGTDLGFVVDSGVVIVTFSASGT
ncbi:MAG: hypothetical protein KAU36_07210 [candidate division Zixibacteria bacterium]|nr:hypothetical protein [candidate division Zixibacteria bacterium]